MRFSTKGCTRFTTHFGPKVAMDARPSEGPGLCCGLARKMEDRRGTPQRTSRNRRRGRKEDSPQTRRRRDPDFTSTTPLSAGTPAGTDHATQAKRQVVHQRTIRLTSIANFRPDGGNFGPAPILDVTRSFVLRGALGGTSWRGGGIRSSSSLS